MSEKKTIFITGTTGLLGSYLLKILLENGHKVYALARNKNEKAAKDRVKEALSFWDDKVIAKYSDNLIVLDGDITEQNLGLKKENIELLRKEIEEIFHCAALTKLNSPLESSRKVNVEGTKNILELCCDWNNRGKLKKVNHISTIFIYGDYQNIFQENNLDVGQKFNTFYEQTKFEAEKLIGEYRNKGLWIDIFRPCAIIGESFTGKIPSLSYALHQLIHIWSKGLLDYFPQGYFLKAVCVDELSRSIFYISSKSLEKNKTYHPFGYDSLSLVELLNLSVEHFKFKKLYIVSKEEFVSKSTPLQVMLLKHNIFFINTNVKAASEATNKFLKYYNFEFSQFTKPLLFNILAYAIKTGFIMKSKERHKD
ncbi:MAG: SDR family oxidoreductase [Candidatus Omnitrophica bacterium]|jgi:long-chain acyl-CoA synthetase|nr:SDR family oxidoreductase [Candidatus Omnitrophota bacterium]